MAGSGTTMLACTLGRDVVVVELEDKFCKMMRDNWAEVKMRPQLGYGMGKCQIIQGDARQLEGLFADTIVSSPPFGEAHSKGDLGVGDKDRADLRDYSYLKSGTEGQIGDLPYGNVDKIITSPPYAAAQSGGGIAQEGYTKPFQKDKFGGGNLDPVGKRSYMPENAGDNPDNIQALPYGEIDSIITSPPYEGSISGESHTEEARAKEFDKLRKLGYKINPNSADNKVRAAVYSGSDDNIGNLKSGSYLEAMLQVYQQCFGVLKPSGLMILVTKNFIRNKQVIRLDTDTIKLCEQAGFKFLERHYRKLPAQSFWRIIYYKKYPQVERINHEDVLVFSKVMV